MIIVLYGVDNYRSRQKLNEIIEHYQQAGKTGFNLMFFDSENAGFSDFENVFKQTSMFNEKKLIVLFNCFNNKIFKEDFLKNVKLFIESSNILLIYESGNVLKKDDLLVFLEKQSKIKNNKVNKQSLASLVKIQEFELLKAEKLKSWVKKEFNKFKAEISSEALNKMIDFIGNDLWQFSNEIKKLVNYKKDKKITIDDLEILLKPKIETAIFKTIDALAQKDKKRALFLIHQHLSKQENSLYILSMISFQFRNLLIVKDYIEKGADYYVVLKKTGFHSFVVRKSFQQADKFTFQELKKIHQKIFQADLNIKTGKMNSETALDLLITGI